MVLTSSSVAKIVSKEELKVSKAVISVAFVVIRVLNEADGAPNAPEISEAIIDYCKGQYFSYGPSEGLIELKKSVASFFILKRNVPVKSDFVLPIDSTAFGIYLTCKTFLNNGDEAIIFDPVDFLFRYSIEKIGAKAIPFSIPPDTKKVDFQKLEHLITNKTKLICLCNPINPILLVI